MNFNIVFYLNGCIQNHITTTCDQSQKLQMSCFTFCLHSKFLKPGVYFSLTAHLPSDLPGVNQNLLGLHLCSPSPEPIPWPLCPWWPNQNSCCCWGLWAAWGREFETGTGRPWSGDRLAWGVWDRMGKTHEPQALAWADELAAAHAQWGGGRGTRWSGARRPALPARHTSFGLFTFI